MIDKKNRCVAAAVFCVALSICQIPAAEAEPCRIQAFGDSITSGIRTGADPGVGGYRAYLVAQPPQVGGIQMVGQHVTYSPPWMVSLGQAWNSGAPGFRIDQLWPFTNPLDPVTPVLPALPDVILVHVGTNDIDQLQGGLNAANDLAYLLDSMLYWHYHVWGNQPTVLVAKIIPMRGLRDFLNGEVNFFNSQIDAIVNARWLSGYEVYSVDQHTGFSKTAHMADDWHPNDAGYELMASRWRSAIEYYGCQ